jgi:galactose mutarotase-like enzyme
MPDGLDATWTDLGVPPVELAWPGLGVSATMRVAADTVFIVAASPPSLDAIAVEPQTHAPQGVRRLLNHEPGALAVLDPRDSLRLSVDLEFRRLTDGLD